MTTVQVDVRVVAATHRDLTQWIREGRFREDLYYRLNVVRLEVPPLRDRLEDVPALADLFLRRYGTRGPTEALSRLTPEAMAALQAQPWPGNVRQLENTLHRASILATGDTLTPEDLDLPSYLADTPSSDAPRATFGACSPASNASSSNERCASTVAISPPPDAHSASNATSCATNCASTACADPRL